MRMTLLEGVEDDIRIDLGSDVTIVCAVMEIGKAKGDLIYEARLTGEEVMRLLKDCLYADKILSKIVKDRHYVLTAFDD